jgi:hypothetical protein
MNFGKVKEFELFLDSAGPAFFQETCYLTAEVGVFSRKHQAYPNKNTFFSNRSRNRTSEFLKTSAEAENRIWLFFETFGLIFTNRTRSRRLMWKVGKVRLKIRSNADRTFHQENP